MKTIRVTALVGLGANLPFQDSPPETIIRTALCALRELGQPVAVSGLWRSKAWPNPDDPIYVNAVARIATTLSAQMLLARLQKLEVHFGRRRSMRNAPRTLDLDIVDYAGRAERLNCEQWRDRSGEETSVILPHPRLQDRAFVLKPMMDVAPLWRHPILQKSALELLNALSVDERCGTWRCAPAKS